MYNDLWTHYLVGVKAAMDDCLKSKNSRKSGEGRDVRAHKNAVLELYHFRDHWAEIDPTMTHDFLKPNCPEYQLLGNVGNAAKHFIVKFGKPVLSRADNIMDCFEINEFKDELGRYDYVEKKVIMLSDVGEKYDVWYLLVKVHNYFARTLYDRGLGQGLFLFDEPKDKVVPRNQARPLSYFNYHQWEGTGLKLQFIWRRYDYETNEFKELKITGAKRLK